jgi:hypothetical protein
MANHRFKTTKVPTTLNNSYRVLKDQMNQTLGDKLDQLLIYVHVVWYMYENISDFIMRTLCSAGERACNNSI